MRLVTRFRDTGEHLHDFAGEVLVVCPRCSACARVAGGRAVCGACAWAKDAPQGVGAFGRGMFRGLPLWLTAPVGDEVLWAYNEEHLALLEGYVAADLRDRNHDDPHNAATMVEKLPAWIKTAKNRDAVLAATARLRKRLAGA